MLDPEGGVSSYMGPGDPDRGTAIKTVESIIPIVGMKVELTNRPIPSRGSDEPEALLKDKYGLVVVAGVSVNHPENVRWGLKMTGNLSGRTAGRSVGRSLVNRSVSRTAR
ncbi:hypothetical protein [Streptomyces sp. NPDC015125]|uniref:hypothetical protein n=1 Tax=Streptomyces sp. NPDC015125 TaxID=3364938 RepID=UPI0036F8548C